jgi:hypothetical protein
MGDRVMTYGDWYYGLIQRKMDLMTVPPTKILNRSLTKLRISDQPEKVTFSTISTQTGNSCGFSE